MAHQNPYRINTISQFHEFYGFPKPEHPLISIVNYSDLHRHTSESPDAVLFGYYTISLKRGVSKMFYGQQKYDFDEGVLYYMAPNQILRSKNNPNHALERSGWQNIDRAIYPTTHPRQTD